MCVCVSSSCQMLTQFHSCGLASPACTISGEQRVIHTTTNTHEPRRRRDCVWVCSSTSVRSHRTQLGAFCVCVCVCVCASVCVCVDLGCLKERLSTLKTVLNSSVEGRGLFQHVYPKHTHTKLLSGDKISLNWSSLVLDDDSVWLLLRLPTHMFSDSWMQKHMQGEVKAWTCTTTHAHKHIYTYTQNQM